MAFTEKYVSSVAGGSGNGLTEGTAYTFTQMRNEVQAASVGPGIRYNIKADGTYTRPTGDDVMDAGSGNNTVPIYFRGYKTTIGDGYLGRSGTNGNGPLILTNIPVINYPDGRFIGPGYSIYESLCFTGGGGEELFKAPRDSIVVAVSSTHDKTNSGARACKVGECTILFECDFLMTNTGPSYVIKVDAGNVKFDSCRIVSSSSTTGGVECEFSTLFYSCLLKGAGGGAGIAITPTGDTNRFSYIRNNTIVGWQDGIYSGASVNRVTPIYGNMITDNTRYGINFPAASMLHIGHNRTRDNVTGATSTLPDWGNSARIIPLVTTDTGGASTDYTNTATNDYSLIPASPGKGVNRPFISDMGPYGLPDPAGSGGGTAVFNPLASNIIKAIP